MQHHYDIPAPVTKPQSVADWEYYAVSVEADCQLEGVHDAFVWYVSQGCHPGIAARRAIVQALQLEADRLAICAT